MARLRFPGRPGQRCGKHFVHYSPDDTKFHADSPTAISCDIQNRLQIFYELFGYSDEEEEFEGFTKEDQIKARALLASKVKRKNAFEKYLEANANLSSASSEHEKHTSGSSESEASSSSIRSRRGMRDILRKSYDQMIKEGLCRPALLRRNVSLLNNSKTKKNYLKTKAPFSSRKPTLRKDFPQSTITLRNHVKCSEISSDEKIKNVTESTLKTEAFFEIEGASNNGLNTSNKKYMKGDDMEFKDKSVKPPNKLLAKRLLEKAKHGCRKGKRKNRGEIGRSVKKKVQKKYNLAKNNNKRISTSRRIIRPVAKSKNKQQPTSDGKSRKYKTISSGGINTRGHGVSIQSNESIFKENDSCMQSIVVSNPKQEQSNMTLYKHSVSVGRKKFVLPPVSARSARKIIPRKRYLDEIESFKQTYKSKLLKDDDSESSKSISSSISGTAVVIDSSSELTEHEEDKRFVKFQSKGGLFDQPLVIEGKRPWKPSLKVQMKLSEMNYDSPFGSRRCSDKSSGTSSGSFKDIIKPDMVSKYADIMSKKAKSCKATEISRRVPLEASKPVLERLTSNSNDAIESDVKRSGGKLEKVAAKIEKLLKSQWEGRLKNSDNQLPKAGDVNAENVPSIIGPLIPRWRSDRQQHASQQRRTKNIIRKAKLQLKKRTLMRLRKPMDIRDNGQSLIETTSTSTGAVVDKPLCLSGSARNTMPSKPKQYARSSVQSVVCSICGLSKECGRVHRRYRQFTCEPCSKFFGDFIKTPEQYFCSSDGNCDILNTRCQACWLTSCLKKFIISPTLRKQLTKFIPRLKSSDETLLNDSANVLQPPLTFTDLARNAEVVLNVTNKCEGISHSTEGNFLDQPNCGSNALKTPITTNAPIEKSTEIKTRGPRIKHVCRRADVVLGLPRATFSGKGKGQFNLSALPQDEKQKILETETGSQGANGQLIDKTEKRNIKSKQSVHNRSGNSYLKKSTLLLKRQKKKKSLIKKSLKHLHKHSLKNSLKVRHRNIVKKSVVKYSYKTALELKKKSVVTSPRKRPVKPARFRKVRCKECEGCLAEDCGKCVFCLDKKKFGGPNLIKQACMFRRCLRPVMPANEKKSTKTPPEGGGDGKPSGGRSSFGGGGPSGIGATMFSSSSSSPSTSPDGSNGSSCGSSCSSSSSSSGSNSSSSGSSSSGNNSSNSGSNGGSGNSGSNTDSCVYNCITSCNNDNTHSSVPQNSVSELLHPKEFMCSEGMDSALCNGSSCCSLPSSCDVNCTVSLGCELPVFETGKSTSSSLNTKSQIPSVQNLKRKERRIFSVREVLPNTDDCSKKQHLVYVDYWEGCDPEIVYSQGFTLISTQQLPLQIPCFLCGSAGDEKLIFCVVCCEPFHTFCLQDDDEPLDQNIENWCCYRCQSCAVCGQKSNHKFSKGSQLCKLLKCKKCQHTYHAECLGPHYPSKPSRKKRLWVCPKCVKCKSCGTTSPTVGSGVLWNFDLLLCQSCTKLTEKGNFCPICQKCYEDDDYESQMMQCSRCDCWVHAKCDSISDEMYEILSRLPETVVYTCINCTTENPPFWKVAIYDAIKKGLTGVLNSLLNARCTRHLVTKKSSGISSICRDQPKINIEKTAIKIENSSLDIPSKNMKFGAGDTVHKLDNQNSSYCSLQSAACAKNCISAVVYNDSLVPNFNSSLNSNAKMDYSPKRNTISVEKGVLEIRKNSELESVGKTCMIKCNKKLILPENVNDSVKSIVMNFVSNRTPEITPLLKDDNEELLMVDAKDMSGTAGNLQLDESSTVLVEPSGPAMVPFSNDLGYVAIPVNLTISKISTSVVENIKNSSCVSDFKTETSDAAMKYQSKAANSLDLMKLKKKLDAGKYKTITAFFDEVVEVFEVGFFEGRKHYAHTARSLFSKQMEKAFPWFQVSQSKLWKGERGKLSSDSLLPHAVVPPSVDHVYAQYLSRGETKQVIQPGKFKRVTGNDSFCDSRVCTLCTKSGDDSPLKCGRLIYCGQDDWIHVNCAMWSAEVFQDSDGSLLNVYPAISRGRLMRCEACNIFGATVGCCVRGCPANYHFQCARDDQAVFQMDKTVYCYLHQENVEDQLTDEADFSVCHCVYVGQKEIAPKWVKKSWQGKFDLSSLSFIVGSLSIANFGYLTTASDNVEALIPVNFECSRIFWSTKNPYQKVIYTCRTLEVIPESMDNNLSMNENLTIVHDFEIPEDSVEESFFNFRNSVNQQISSSLPKNEKKSYKTTASDILSNDAITLEIKETENALNENLCVIENCFGNPEFKSNEKETCKIDDSYLIRLGTVPTKLNCESLESQERAINKLPPTVKEEGITQLGIVSRVHENNSFKTRKTEDKTSVIRARTEREACNKYSQNLLVRNNDVKYCEQTKSKTELSACEGEQRAVNSLNADICTPSKRKNYCSLDFHFKNGVSIAKKNRSENTSRNEFLSDGDVEHADWDGNNKNTLFHNSEAKPFSNSDHIALECGNSTVYNGEFATKDQIGLSLLKTKEAAALHESFTTNVEPQKKHVNSSLLNENSNHTSELLVDCHSSSIFKKETDRICTDRNNFNNIGNTVLDSSEVNLETKSGSSQVNDILKVKNVERNKHNLKAKMLHRSNGELMHYSNGAKVDLKKSYKNGVTCNEHELSILSEMNVIQGKFSNGNFSGECNELKESKAAMDNLLNKLADVESNCNGRKDHIKRTWFPSLNQTVKSCILNHDDSFLSFCSDIATPANQNLGSLKAVLHNDGEYLRNGSIPHNSSNIVTDHKISLDEAGIENIKPRLCAKKIRNILKTYPLRSSRYQDSIKRMAEMSEKDIENELKEHMLNKYKQKGYSFLPEKVSSILEPILPTSVITETILPVYDVSADQSPEQTSKCISSQETRDSSCSVSTRELRKTPGRLSMFYSQLNTLKDWEKGSSSVKKKLKNDHCDDFLKSNDNSVEFSNTNVGFVNDCFKAPKEEKLTYNGCVVPQYPSPKVQNDILCVAPKSDLNTPGTINNSDLSDSKMLSSCDLINSCSSHSENHPKKTTILNGKYSSSSPFKCGLCRRIYRTKESFDKHVVSCDFVIDSSSTDGDDDSLENSLSFNESPSSSDNDGCQTNTHDSSTQNQDFGNHFRNEIHKLPPHDRKNVCKESNLCKMTEISLTSEGLSGNIGNTSDVRLCRPINEKIDVDFCVNSENSSGVLDCTGNKELCTFFEESISTRADDTTESLSNCSSASSSEPNKHSAQSLEEHSVSMSLNANKISVSHGKKTSPLKRNIDESRLSIVQGHQTPEVDTKISVLPFSETAVQFPSNIQVYDSQNITDFNQIIIDSPRPATSIDINSVPLVTQGVSNAIGETIVDFNNSIFSGSELAQVSGFTPVLSQSVDISSAQQLSYVGSITISNNETVSLSLNAPGQVLQSLDLVQPQLFPQQNLAFNQPVLMSAPVQMQQTSSFQMSSLNVQQISFESCSQHSTLNTVVLPQDQSVSGLQNQLMYVGGTALPQQISSVTPCPQPPSLVLQVPVASGEVNTCSYQPFFGSANNQQIEQTFNSVSVNHYSYHPNIDGIPLQFPTKTENFESMAQANSSNFSEIFPNSHSSSENGAFQQMNYMQPVISNNMNSNSGMETSFANGAAVSDHISQRPAVETSLITSNANLETAVSSISSNSSQNIPLVNILRKAAQQMLNLSAQLSNNTQPETPNVQAGSSGIAPEKKTRFAHTRKVAARRALQLKNKLKKSQSNSVLNSSPVKVPTPSLHVSIGTLNSQSVSFPIPVSLVCEKEQAFETSSNDLSGVSLSHIPLNATSPATKNSSSRETSILYEKLEDDNSDDGESPLLAAHIRQEKKIFNHVENTSKDKPYIVFEISSEDGFYVRSPSANEAWKTLYEELQDARINAHMKQIPISQEDVDGIQLFGLNNNAVRYLLEQLPGAESCTNYNFNFHPPVKDIDVVPENASGCARTERFAERKEHDMFNFLASEHRKRPAYEYATENEDGVHKSSRRATSLDLPMAMRFRHLKTIAREAVGVFRSNIHGRGLFCKRNIDPGELVIEYAGEVIRSVLTDKRERIYQSKGIGCYMFRIDDEEVVDATMHGNAARFINHSCEPNCFSKVIAVDGKKHIVIFALRRILKGEELTYDYKFPFEEEKIPCSCNSRRCRKYLN